MAKILLFCLLAALAVLRIGAQDFFFQCQRQGYDGSAPREACIRYPECDLFCIRAVGPIDGRFSVDCLPGSSFCCCNGLPLPPFIPPPFVPPPLIPPPFVPPPLIPPPVIPPPVIPPPVLPPPLIPPPIIPPPFIPPPFIPPPFIPPPFIPPYGIY